MLTPDELDHCRAQRDMWRSCRLGPDVRTADLCRETAWALGALLEERDELINQRNTLLTLVQQPTAPTAD